MKEKIISLVNLVSLFFQKLFLLMIRFYQAAISPHLGKNCRFTPTCSQYAYIAITRFGPIKGTYLAIKRLSMRAAMIPCLRRKKNNCPSGRRSRIVC